VQNNVYLFPNVILYDNVNNLVGVLKVSVSGTVGNLQFNGPSAIPSGKTLVFNPTFYILSD
jgi:hypothetical protein